MMPFGIAILFLTAFAVIITLATDSVPANWPFQPIHREDDPAAYRLCLIGYGIAGTVGLLLFVIGLLTHR
jgi:hypothetical protein